MGTKKLQVKLDGQRYIMRGPSVFSVQTLSEGETTIMLPNDKDLLITLDTFSAGGGDIKYLGFSADFDLVVCTEYNQWYTYEIHGDSLLSSSIYIYDQDIYDSSNNKLLIEKPTYEVLRQRYKPIAILYFDTTTDVLTICRP